MNNRFIEQAYNNGLQEGRREVLDLMKHDIDLLVAEVHDPKLQVVIKAALMKVYNSADTEYN